MGEGDQSAIKTVESRSVEQDHQHTAAFSMWQAAEMATPLLQSQYVTVILDIDEVLCLGPAEVGWDLSQLLKRGEPPSVQKLSGLFSPVARNALAVVHRRMGHVKYAISSSWREHFSREQLAAVFDAAGFYFVAKNLHEGDAWRCVPIHVHREREADVQAWLLAHHQGEPFVILDDRYSAGRLLFVNHFPDSPLFGRVVICTPGVGLTMDHVEGIVETLRRPT